MGKFPCGIWHNSNLVVLLFFWFIYFWGRKNQSALKLVLDFESPSKFWGFRITYRLPVGLPLLRKRPIKNIVQIDYPRVSPGAHPLAKKPEDSGYEIETYLSFVLWVANLVLRVFSAFNMAAGLETLAHSELKRSLIGPFLTWTLIGLMSKERWRLVRRAKRRTELVFKSFSKLKLFPKKQPQINKHNSQK